MPPRNPESRSHPDRLLPVVAAAFAELGYRRATTAQLAKRCGVRENILYRSWPSKKAMFLASIEHVLHSSLEIWGKLLVEEADPQQAAQRVLDYEATHHGEFGLYRIIFAGLSETDDPEIQAALRRMYLQFHQFIAERVAKVRPAGTSAAPAPELVAWAMVGLGTITNISRELRLMPGGQREELFRRIGRLLLSGSL